MFGHKSSWWRLVGRILLRSPKGPEHYPAIVVRSHVTEGATVANGDMLYEIKTAQGRNLGIRASQAGRTMSPPYPEGMTLHAQVLLAELEPDGAQADAKLNAKRETAKPKSEPRIEKESAQPKYNPRKIMLRTPGQQDLYPLTIVTVHVEQGASVSKGDTLYELSCSNGRRIGIPSPEAGRLNSPTYPAGFQFDAPGMLAEIATDAAKAAIKERPSEGAPNPSNARHAECQGTPPQENKQHDKHTRKPQPRKGTTDPDVLKAVERERDTTPSAFLRSFWTAQTPDVRWGGVGPVLKMSLLFAGIMIACQLVLRAINPDLDLEALLLPSMGIAILSAFLTVRIVRHWRHRPSPLGLFFPLAGIASLSIGASIIPDREIYYATGFDPAETPIEILGSINSIFQASSRSSSSSSSSSLGRSSASSDISNEGADDFYLNRIGARPLGGAKSRVAPPDLQNKFDDWINS